MMPYLSCKKIENDVYNFPTWQYCKYKDIFDSRIIINSTAKFYISISYQKDLLSIDTRIFTPSRADEESYAVSVPKDTLAKLIVVSKINNVELEELIHWSYVKI